MSDYTLEVYEDSAREWRWRIKHANGRIIADGGEGYSTRSNAIRAARRLRWIAWAARLVKE
jgi:uncharacterized protein YegP (UPF0339 family)